MLSTLSSDGSTHGYGDGYHHSRQSTVFMKDDGHGRDELRTEKWELEYYKNKCETQLIVNEQLYRYVEELKKELGMVKLRERNKAVLCRMFV